MWRTGFDGQAGPHGVYHRYATRQLWEPPFRWSGRIRVLERMPSPWRLWDGDEISYRPAVVFFVQHQDNDHNVLIGVGGEGQRLVSISAELPDGYGARTGYESRVRVPSFDLAGTGWHTFDAVVDDHHRYRLRLDGAVLADVVEKQPATLSGPVGVGLRLDFFDVEVADMVVTPG